MFEILLIDFWSSEVGRLREVEIDILFKEKND